MGDRTARAEAIEGFAAVLSQLRDETGRPSFRTMAGRSRAISHTTLHEAAQGNRLPSWGTTAEFVRACGADPADYRERWEKANRAVGPAGPADATVAERPETSGPRAAGAGGPPLARGHRWPAVAAVTALGLLTAGGTAAWALTGRDGRASSTPPPPSPTATVATLTAAQCPVRQQNPPPQPPAHEGDREAFVRDVSLPDCTHVGRGQSLTKTWRFRNTGSLDWKGYALQRVDLPQTRDQCQTAPEVAVPPTRPGHVVDVSVAVTTPNVATFCFVRFRIVDPAGAVAFPDHRPVNFQVFVD